jgi:hypothetical protein
MKTPTFIVGVWGATAHLATTNGALIAGRHWADITSPRIVGVQEWAEIDTFRGALRHDGRVSAASAAWITRRISERGGGHR